jgi:hypothetical protein
MEPEYNEECVKCFLLQQIDARDKTIAELRDVIAKAHHRVVDERWEDVARILRQALQTKGAKANVDA